MLLSIVYTVICIILVVFVFFFMLGNISLMQEKKNKLIKTRDSIGSISSNIPNNNNKEIIDDLEKYGRNLINESDSDCQSAKQQIMREYKFKQQKDKKNIYNLIPGLSKEMSSVEESTTTAPVLETFEDYAPVDISVNVPHDKGIIHLSKTYDCVPKAVNTYDTQRLSKFGPEYRVPWNGKKGKNDLSYFFDTHKTNESFDQTQRQLVICPSEWEKKTKN